MDDPLSTECPAGMYQCRMGACVPGEGRCDGIQTCPDNSDENFWANCDGEDGGGDGGKPLVDPTSAPVAAGLIVGSVICAILFLIVIALIIANLVIRHRRQTERKRHGRLLTIKDGERRSKRALYSAGDVNRSRDSASDVGTANPGFTMPDSLRPSYEDLARHRSDVNKPPVKVNPYDSSQVRYVPSKGPAYEPKNKEDYDKPNPYLESTGAGPPPYCYGSQDELPLRPDTLRHPNWEPDRGYQHGGAAYAPNSYQGQQGTPPSRRSDDPALQRKSLTGSGSLLPYLSLTGVGTHDHPDLEYVQAMSNGHTSSFEGSTSDIGRPTGAIHSEV